MKRALVLAGGGSRGAFQIGIWKYLMERNWIPDIICGTSIGAVNAAGIASGLDLQTLTRLWTTYGRRKLYRLNLIQFLSCYISGRSLKPLFDTGRLQALLSELLDFEAVKASPTKIVISTVNVRTAQTHFYQNRDIGLEHVLASSALPILFPWHAIDGVPHWDGGTMANIPLQPALDFGADEIIIAMLSPIRHTPQAFPRDVRTALEHVFEQFLAASFQSTLTLNNYNDRPLGAVQTRYRNRTGTGRSQGRPPNIITLAPKKMLGFRSLINFSLPQARRLIDEGYTTANTCLKPFI